MGDTFSQYGYSGNEGSGPSQTRPERFPSAPAKAPSTKLPKVKKPKQQNGTYETTLRDGLPKMKPTAYTSGKD